MGMLPLVLLEDEQERKFTLKKSKKKMDIVFMIVCLLVLMAYAFDCRSD
jgi:hypothetical protein